MKLLLILTAWEGELGPHNLPGMMCKHPEMASLCASIAAGYRQACPQGWI